MQARDQNMNDLMGHTKESGLYFAQELGQKSKWLKWSTTGRSCNGSSDGPQWCRAVIQTSLERKAGLCLVLNEVWLRCSDVPEDRLVQAIKGNSQQATGMPTCLWKLEVQDFM